MVEFDQDLKASVDFSKIAPGMEGKCVVVRVADQVPLGYGDTIDEALTDAGVSKDDEGIVLTRVPLRMAALFV